MNLSEKKLRSSFLLFTFCSVGVVLTVLLQTLFLVPAFVASASVGFAASFMPKRKSYDADQLTACVYSGSFAAMCGLSYFSKWQDVFLLCVLVSLSFLLLKPYFRGFGGKLGSIAFVASMIFVGLKGVI